MDTRLHHPLEIPKNKDMRAKERFASALRGYVLNNLANEMREDYEQHVVPAVQQEGADLPVDGVAVHKLIREREMFRMYSSLRCTAQELVWSTVIDPVNDASVDLASMSEQFSSDHSATGGSLELDSSLAVPGYYDAVDVHLMPGNYDGRSADAGVLPGAVYDNGFNVFAFGAMGKQSDDIGCSMANFVRLKFPDINPAVIVDAGCTIGHNTVPWKQTFPDAEVYGLDIAEGCLRYGHARAQAMGVPIQFHQRSSDDLGFEDNSVDIVFSSMFLHELPKKHIQRFLTEAHRVLKPGGVLLNMELPPNDALTPYDAFYLDWDSYYNNEPFYKNFRDQDPQQLCIDAGFLAGSFFQTVMPRYTYVEEEVFKQAICGEAQFNEDTGRLSDGIQWYGFGAVKAPLSS
jgi:ubiquinone/menaquinone biosynthesis C-methylase UbiE